MIKLYVCTKYAIKTLALLLRNRQSNYTLAHGLDNSISRDKEMPEND